MGFLDNLCGARQAYLHIKDPDRIGFDAKKIVSDIATVMARIWQQENNYAAKQQLRRLAQSGFVTSLAEHPDFSRPVLVKVASVVKRHMLCDAVVISDYTTLLEQVIKAFFFILSLL